MPRSDQVRLGVNVDHVATLRQARQGGEPDPVEAALVCVRAGAAGIVCHLREDRRHIQEEDVKRLARRVVVPVNLEMAMARDVVACALAIRPAQVTLVPERRQELTTEGGLDLCRLTRRLKPLVGSFRERRIAVSLFVDPVPEQIAAAAALGVEIIELHTGAYANAGTPSGRARALMALARAASQARACGLVVAAGHGLDYANIRAIVRMPEIEEVNIGFSIITRALAVGLERAVHEMVALLHRPPTP
jgi:pyridoxine 5-phosphate synthase